MLLRYNSVLQSETSEIKVKFLPLVFLMILGCQTNSQQSKVESYSHNTNRFIDSEIGSEASLIINASDLIRKSLQWSTQDPKNDEITVSIINADLKTISENKSCAKDDKDVGFTCRYTYIFQSNKIDENAELVFETKRMGRLLARYEIELIEGRRVTKTTAKFYKIGDRPDVATVVRKGDALLFEADWSTSKFGMTKSESVHFGIDLTKMWENVDCKEGECRYTALFQVDGTSQQGAIAVHLVNQGNSVRTWQQKIIIR